MNTFSNSVLCSVLLLGAFVLMLGYSAAAQNIRSEHQPLTAVNNISREEVELLLVDVAKTNPMVLKRFADDPEMKKQQLESLKRLLAFASEAIKEGLAEEPTNRQELQNIRAEVEAVNYDQEKNRGKGPMSPFGFITEREVGDFWSQMPAKREAEFQEFLATKITFIKASGNVDADREVTAEEKEQARQLFAKMKIYENEFDEKSRSGTLPAGLAKKVALQVKLQQAQFLARLLSAKITEKTKATDEGISAYISTHPELGVAAARTRAEALLRRAKANEDFAKLANEFSQDPGNIDRSGAAQGGLYKDVPKGKMMPSFEAAALALVPGQVGPDLVETDYGYHILKLERKGVTKDAAGNSVETYDVRHILFSTTIKDPTNPGGTDVPVRQYVRKKLESEKESRLVAELVKSNQISVPDDFTVPPVSAKQLQEMMKKIAQDDQIGASNAQQTASKSVRKPASATKKRQALRRPVRRRTS